jgi:hypothetical protein
MKEWLLTLLQNILMYILDERIDEPKKEGVNTMSEDKLQQVLEVCLDLGRKYEAIGTGQNMQYTNVDVSKLVTKDIKTLTDYIHQLREA